MDRLTSKIRKLAIPKDVALKRELMMQESTADIPMAAIVAPPPPSAFPGKRVAVSPEMFADLEVHAPLRDGGSDLMTAIDCTYTRGGRAFIAALIDNPISDVETLEKRQTALKGLHVDGIGRLLETLRDTEGDVAWLFAYRDDETLHTLYNMAYFRSWPFRRLNALSPAALTGANLHRVYASPTIGLLAPITYFVIPYLVIRFGMGVAMPIKAYLKLMYASMTSAGSMMGRGQWAQYASCAFSLVFYFQSVFTSFEVSHTLSKVCKSLTCRARKVAAFFEAAAELEARVWTTALVEPFLVAEGVSEGGPVFAGVSGTTNAEPGWLFGHGNFGNELRAMHAFDYVAAEGAVRRAYALDAILSIPATLKKLRGSWAAYVSGGPALRLEGLRHPCVKDAVPNSWTLGMGAGERVNAILTGPNAGGKSTLLKGVLISTLLAQTLTIAPCARLSITPFAYVSSHINVPDAQGRESLFEAEMRRAKRNLDELRRLSEGEPALVVMDEIFSSTNPVEGIAGAYAVAKHMASLKNCVSVISTHYTYLARLSSERKFVNFRMPVVVDRTTGAVTAHPYKLRRGVSRQYVALELLRASGFGDEVINDAIEVKRMLCGGPEPEGPKEGELTGGVEELKRPPEDPQEGVEEEDDGAKE
jgi:hypothetical protein